MKATLETVAAAVMHTGPNGALDLAAEDRMRRVNAALDSLETLRLGTAALLRDQQEAPRYRDSHGHGGSAPGAAAPVVKAAKELLPLLERWRADIVGVRAGSNVVP